jgi:hypothetical protein
MSDSADVPRLESLSTSADKPMILLRFSVNFITGSSLRFIGLGLTVAARSRFYEL